MSGFEDRMRGYKRENLIGDSDSEEERTTAVSRQESEGATGGAAPGAASTSVPQLDGIPKTGPKGVLADYYQQMVGDQQRSILDGDKRRQLIKQHSATVRSYADEKAAADKSASDATAAVNVARALDGGSLDHESFMRSYRATRMTELKKQASLGHERKRFGSLMEIRGDSYASIIDNCPPSVTLVIHIYNELYHDCVHMNKCLTRLAKLYPTVKMCRVQSVALGLSQMFSESGLPTVLVYKDGDMIGNFPRIVNELGKVYELEDLEHFLRDKGCLPSESEKEDETMFGGAMKLLGMSRIHPDRDED